MSRFVVKSLPEEADMVIQRKVSFLHHLQQTDSAFVKAVKEGKWVLLDGIESAPKDLFENISTLCNKKP
jgi:midasin (ATPase involved in ribosome maturation)